MQCGAHIAEATNRRLGQWVLRNLPSNVNHVKTWNAYAMEYVAGRDFLTLPTCVLVSNKASVPPLFAALSREYAKHFDFLFVSSKDGDDAKVIRGDLEVCCHQTYN